MAKIKTRLSDFHSDRRLVDERGPTAERVFRAGKDLDIGDTGVICVRDCPIDRAVKRGQINEKGYQAGIKFRHHWWHAGMAGKLTSIDLDNVFARDFSNMGHMPKSEAQYFHRQKHREACELLGIRTESVVTDIICREVEFEESGRKLGYLNAPQARVAALTLLQDGVERLAKLWGI